MRIPISDPASPVKGKEFHATMDLSYFFIVRRLRVTEVYTVARAHSF